MANNNNITSNYANQPLFELREYAWMLSTFVLTPLTAAVLAATGYILMDPLVAAVSGLLVSFMYVGFRVINAWRRFRLFKSILAKKTDDAIVTE